MQPSDVFFELVKTRFAPCLRASGFKGSGRTFRRRRGDCIEIVNLQTSTSGGKCAVNLALSFSFLPSVNPAQITQAECDFRKRLTPEGVGDFWWDFGDGAQRTVESVSHLIAAYERNGVPFFARFGEFPGGYTEITVHDLQQPGIERLPGGTGTSRYALFFTHMWMHLQEPARARSFAEFGLSTCAQAIALRATFRKLLAEIDQGRPLNELSASSSDDC
jgi:hypothetical protein